MFVIVACVDTIARISLNGTIQFNGHYGCDWCEHPGKYHARSMRYPLRNPPAPARTKASTIKYAQEALKKFKSVVGVKSASPLLNLEGFDIIRGCTPDYMHCVLAGVTNQFTEYFLRMLKPDEIDNLDELLFKIKAPKQLGRLSRGIRELCPLTVMVIVL